MFIDNLLAATALKADQLTLYVENRRVGWIAGPEKHHGRDYWMSTDVLDGSEVAEILSEVTGRSIAFNPQGPDDFKALVSAPGSGAEPWYAEGGVDFMRQIVDGRMGYIGTIRDEVLYVLGRPALTSREWASEHKEEFIKLASATDQL